MSGPRGPIIGAVRTLGLNIGGGKPITGEIRSQPLMMLPGPGSARSACRGRRGLGHPSTRPRRFDRGCGFPCIDGDALEIEPFVYDAGPGKREMFVSQPSRYCPPGYA
jgi:hypothetical protein